MLAAILAASLGFEQVITRQQQQQHHHQYQHQQQQQQQQQQQGMLYYVDRMLENIDKGDDALAPMNNKYCLLQLGD